MAATLASPGNKVMAPTKLAHIVLQSANYAETVAYYTTFLGARAAYASDIMTLLRYDDEHHRIGILNMPDFVRPAALPRDIAGVTGLAHVAFTYPSFEALCIAWLQRKNNGIKPVWTVNHGPTMSAYYRDPDGNVIETQSDSMDDEAADAFMRSEAYGINPIGVDFNMEDMIRRLRAGESEESLVRRVENGPRGLDSVPLVAH